MNVEELVAWMRERDATLTVKRDVHTRSTKIQLILADSNGTRQEVSHNLLDREIELGRSQMMTNAVYGLTRVFEMKEEAMVPA